MYILIKNRQTIGVVFCLMLNFSLYSYDQTFLDYVFNNNLNTFAVIEREVRKKVDKKPLSKMNYSEMIAAIRTPRELDLKDLNERDKREIIIKQIVPVLNKQDNVIDRFFIDKMEIVHGSARPQEHLMHRLTTDLTGKPLLKTEVGVKRFIEIISQPITDIKELTKRQSIIKELVNNDALRDKCNQLFDKIKSVERLFLELYTKQDLEELENSLYFNTFFDKLGWNKPSPLTISTRFNQVMASLSALSAVIAAIAAGIVLPAKIKRIHDIKTGKDLTEVEKVATQEERELEVMIEIGKTAAVTTYTTLVVPFLTIIGLAQLKIQVDAILNMQEILLGFATYLRSLKEIFNLVNSNSTLQPLVPQIKPLLQKLTHDDTGFKEFNELNKILKEGTFGREKPSVFSSPGNILVAYKYMVQPAIRQQYIEVFNMLGELDAYVALANKIKSHQNESCAKFCFVTFKANESKPMIQAKGFWNIFVDYKKVVCNDISLNTGNERNIILTGPNTGGKSTLMKAIMITLQLAQTFGISTAESVTMTPFAKLITYMNIADDISGGISLFKAEVKRAQELIETLQSLKPGEFAFVIVDEMFTGTSPDKAESLSYNFMEQLSHFTNCIFIDATHFKKLVGLEKDTNGIVKNYHTGVMIDPSNPDKVLQYTYKLTPGPSPVVNAEQIAEEEGIVSFKPKQE